MLVSLFLGGVAIAYRWEILWVLFFTLVFSLFLVLAGYTYMTSQRDSAYETLRKQKQIDEEDAKRRMEYFANMAHEIRTPINAILGYDELILREYNDPALRQYAYNIRSAGNTLLALINDSLDYSRIEAGKMELFVSEYDLGTVIEDMMSLIRPRALAKGLELKGFINKNAPRRLYGDANRLKQCMANILTNAVKYTQEGEIDFSVDFESLSKDTILLKVAVRDTGIGIKEEDIKKLYEPFERIDEDRLGSIEGSGLGISIVRKILSLMDSELQVESIYGEGSNFHFSIKQRVAGPESIGDFAQGYARNVIDKTHFEISFKAPEARVLVADDAELNLAVMEGLLNGTGIQVDSAMSAATALEFAKNNDYDLIFLDLNLPEIRSKDMIKRFRGESKNDLGGKESRRSNMMLHRRVQEKAKNKDKQGGNKDGAKERTHNSATPVIALTAGVLQDVQSEYKKLGFSDYLLKPIVYKELETILSKYLPHEKIIRNSNKINDYIRKRSSDTPLLATDEKLQEALNILAQREQVN